MNKEKKETHFTLKGFFSYISSVISWTIFVLLMLIGILLIYYYISLQLYKTKGEKFEPFFSIYTIVSPSMEPNINTLDAIINIKINSAADVKINDVITFISTWKVNYGMTVTHRVVGMQNLDDGSICFITRGDNRADNDEGCVKESNIIGVVKAVIPGFGKLQKFLASGIGWLLVIVLPALYILIKDIIKIVKNVNKKNKKPKKNLPVKTASENNIQTKTVNKEPLEETSKKREDDINKKLEQAYEDLKKILRETEEKGKKDRD